MGTGRGGVSPSACIVGQGQGALRPFALVFLR